MKPTVAFLSFLLLNTAVAQQHDETRPSGVIFGIAVEQNRQAASRIGLTAFPLGAALGGGLRHTTTNDRGEYRFQNLPWGSYTVYPDDEEAGYSSYSTGREGNSDPPEVEVTPDHREAELRMSLPPKAGFVQVHLTNRLTGVAISAMRVTLTAADPVSPLFTMSCYSTQVILVPSNKDLLLHVTSDGFREWDESVGTGKPIHLTPGTRLTLTVQLDPIAD